MAFSGGEEVIEIYSSEDECSVKEQPQITDGIHVLNEFLKVCKPLLKSNQLKVITKLLTDKFKEARRDYTQSEKFRNLVQQHISDLQMKQKSVYVHIQDVKTALLRVSGTCGVKLNTVKDEKKKVVESAIGKEVVEPAVKEEVHVTVEQSVGDSAKNGKEEDKEDKEDGETHQKEVPSESLEMFCETVRSEAAENDLEETVENVLVEEKTIENPQGRGLDDAAGPSTSFHSPRNDTNKTPDNKSIATKLPKIEDSDGNTEQKDKGKGSKKQIRKLERMLSRLDKAIKRLQERELTLDEMDEGDSTHIQEYQLRRRFVKVYNMLCKLNNSSESTGRVIEQRVRYKGTRFPEINRRLERLVNKKDFFPDFHDVYTAIYKTNLKKNLGLDKRRVNSIAQEAFEDIGGKLQKRRQQDFLLNFSSHSTIDFANARDLADKDPELKRKLMENKVVAKQNIKEVEDTFVRRQEECEKKGIDLEASEHSESDAHSEGPSDDDEGGDDGPVVKKCRLDQDECLEGNGENGGENSREDDEDDEKEENKTEGSMTRDFQSTDPPNSDTFSGQRQQSLPHQLMQQQHNTHIPKTHTHTEKPPSNVPTSTFSNGASNTNLNTFSVSHNNNSFGNFTNSWTENIREKPARFSDVNRISDHPVTALNSKICTLPPSFVRYTQSPRFDTPEQAVKSLRLVQPAVPPPSMPLVITNVCSLSSHAGFFPGPDNKSWDEGKATIAQVLDDGNGGFRIGPPSQQQIMLVQSGKRVKLETSTPITLSFEDTGTDSSAEHPLVKPILAPSPPPSVSSTQPELDSIPDVEEVVVASTKSAHLWQTEQRLKTTTTAGPATREVTYTQHQSRTETTHARQVVVSKTSCVCNSACCNHCKQRAQEARNHSCKQFCVQSTHVSNSGAPSHPPKTKARTSSFVRVLDKSSAAAVHPRSRIQETRVPAPTINMKSFSMPPTAQDRVFKIRQVQHFPKFQISPQWQQEPRRRNATTPEKACSRKLNFNPLTSVTNVDDDDDDSDVVIISDSESETKEKRGNRAESPEVICISDSD